MATQYMTESRYSPMQLPSGFSIVVDDVDGDREPLSLPEEEVAAVASPSPSAAAAAGASPVEEAQEALEALPCECGSSHERRGSRGRGPLEEQLCSERIRRYKVEAESRKTEFAKLLEEHAQVVLRVKQMELRELPHDTQQEEDEEEEEEKKDEKQEQDQQQDQQQEGEQHPNQQQEKEQKQDQQSQQSPSKERHPPTDDQEPTSKKTGGI